MLDKKILNYMNLNSSCFFTSKHWYMDIKHDGTVDCTAKRLNKPCYVYD